MSRFQKGKIGDFLTLQRGFDITKDQQIGGRIPVISSSGIASYHNECRAKGPGVVIGRKGTLGTAFYVKGDYWPHDTSLWVKDFKGNNPEFVYYFLKALPLEKLDSGSANPTLNRNVVHLLPATFPRLPEQERIAAVLSALDAKIELNNRINEELEGMAKLLYDYWFVQYDFPISAAQAAAMGKPHLEGKPYRASGGKLTHNETLKREIPEGWLVGNILAVSELGGGGTPSKKAPEFWSGDIPFFTPTDATNTAFCIDTEDHITEEGLKKSATRLYPKGTLFITARGSVGKAMIVSRAMAMNQSCYALSPSEGVGSAFLYFHTLSLMEYLHAKSSGSVFKSIVTNDIKFTPAIVPAAEHLAAFGQVADPIFESILNNQMQNAELTALRDWLLPMLMNGQVSVA